MIFTINGEDFIFNLQVDSTGKLTSFTATRGKNITVDNFNCSIQVESESSAELFCCTPSGCTAGPCLVT